MNVRAHQILSHPAVAKLDRSPMLVLCRLLSYLNESTGTAWPSMPTLVEDTELSERTIQRAMMPLVEAGILTITPGGGRCNPNRYRFVNPVTLDDGVSGEKPRQHTGGDKTPSSDKPRQSDAETPSKRYLNPVTLDDGGTEERRNGDSVTSDRSIPPAGGMEFPVKGGGVWTLPENRLSEYREIFSGIDIKAELRKARLWLQDRPGNLKTARGMGKFLSGWLGRAGNPPAGGSGRAGHTRTPPTEPPAMTDADYLADLRESDPKRYARAVASDRLCEADPIRFNELVAETQRLRDADADDAAFNALAERYLSDYMPTQTTGATR